MRKPFKLYRKGERRITATTPDADVAAVLCGLMQLRVEYDKRVLVSNNEAATNPDLAESFETGAELIEARKRERCRYAFH
jgi:hypothetical protein